MFEKKFTAKIGKKIINDIYFHARKRNRMKRNFLNIQKAILEIKNSSIKPVLKEEYKDRKFYSSWLYISIKFLETIKDAENLKYKTTLKNCSFKLYKSKKRKAVIIKNTFFKVHEGKNRTTFIEFPNGLPVNRLKKRCNIYRKEYGFNPDDYELIDIGRFRQEIVSFSEFSNAFKGKMFNKKILFKQINKSNDNQWAKLADNT